MIHLLPPEPLLPLLTPFDRPTWLIGSAIFTACCFLLSVSKETAFTSNLIDTLYALPLLQRDQKFHWRSNHSKVLMVFYSLCARIGLCLYSAVLIKLLAQSHTQRFSNGQVLKVLRSGLYTLLLGKFTYIDDNLFNKENQSFKPLRDAIQGHTVVVSNHSVVLSK